MYSETAARMASEEFPEYKSTFFQLSKYCGLARILQGVHFASDNKASVIAIEKLELIFFIIPGILFLELNL